MSLSESDYLDDAEVARLLKVSLITLKHWRRRATGPAYFRIGRKIRYLRCDVDTWLTSRKVSA
jgi:predicted DNA-binding transcriptional regulator AlpA